MPNFLYRKLIEPLSAGEDSRRREFILNVILLASIALLLWSEFYLAYSKFQEGPQNKGVSLAWFSGIVLLFLALYAVSRLGYFAKAAYGLVGIYFVSISYAAYLYGPNLPAALLAYAMLIVVASILISTRFGFVVTLATAAVIMILGYYESVLGFLPDLHWKRKTFMLSDGVEYSVLLGVIMVVSWLSNREIERSLIRARKSEAELKTERDLLEVKVEERTRELREVQLARMDELARFAEVGRLASGMVHDLLNPLTAVALNLAELEHKRGKLTDAGEHLESAVNSTRRMENLIAAIRKHMSRTAQEAFFSPERETEQVLTLFAYKAEKANVRLEFKPSQESQIYGDPVKFHEIIANLVSNAIDAYEGLPAGAKRPRKVTISLNRERENLRIAVRDWGVGIAAEDLSKIFNPFFTTKEVSRGTGLGLAAVKHAVEVFGGKIEVESRPGEGSVFKVEILI